MKFFSSTKKKIAVTLLIIWGYQILGISIANALTSGPAQPEASGFNLVGTDNMVDLFSGDFSYNIPIMDVDGYPINLNYQSGSGMDDEASWVGFGWNLNTGSVTRQLRGLPDDINGDEIETEFYTKPKVTIGGKINFSTEIFGADITDKLSKSKPKIGFTLGIFNDNYTGIGAEIGANVGLSINNSKSDKFTSSLGIGLTSSTAGGVDVSPSFSLKINNEKNEAIQLSALSLNGGYNTRAGIKELSLSPSYKAGIINSSIKLGLSFNDNPVYPKIETPYTSSFGSFSFSVGPSAAGLYISAGSTGYKSVHKITQLVHKKPGYGFLYASKGKKNSNAIMDFSREKDGVVSPETPAIAIPIPGQDVFNFTSSLGAGQFKFVRGGTGVFGDNTLIEKTANTSIGLETSVTLSHLGVNIFDQKNTNKSGKWINQNIYAEKADFQDNQNDLPEADPIYFKMSGDRSKLKAKKDFDEIEGPLAVGLNGKTSKTQFTNNIVSRNFTNPIIQNTKVPRSTSIIYLTAKESKNEFDKINNFQFNNSQNQPNLQLTDVQDRNGQFRKDDHISKIIVNNENGQRLIYGQPVYNIKQGEYTYAIGKANDYNEIVQGQNLSAFNITDNKVNHKKGIDHFYRKDVQPAYAYAYMLSKVASPDYVDRSGNGISRDDLGSAWDFNYSTIPNYKWRTPYGNKTGIINKGLLADEDDDKASFIYGEKELTYIHSIASKNKIAFFITEDRNDGLGVMDWQGEKNTVVKQKYLKEIRLYSKKPTGGIGPLIKKAVFEYSYSICPQVPNQVNTNEGKLTLQKVYFTYGNSEKGKNHKYEFNYKLKLDQTQNTVIYSTNSTDRWGTYKPVNENPNFRNEEFSYTKQDTTNEQYVDNYVSLWQLNQIILPTGGVINVEYESDDYAYVQNKKASSMVSFNAITDEAGERLQNNNFINAKGFELNLATPTGIPESELKKWFINNYLDGSEYLYLKAYLNFGANSFYKSKTINDWDWINAYPKIKSVINKNQKIVVLFENANFGGVDRNPVIFSAWQKIKNEYPRFGFPGYVNRLSDESIDKAVKTAVLSIVNAVKTLGELKENFYKKAERKKFCNEINLYKSFIRLVKADGKKKGGGARVKTIKISDEWNLSLNGNTKAVYGQSYDYTTLLDGKKISSGVAASEPHIGSDENTLRQPIPYLQKIKGAVDNFFNIDAPFGETLYPAAHVGYSSVKITDLYKGNIVNGNSETGYTVNEFYTAKDFPVISSLLPITRTDNRPVSIYSMIRGESIHEQALSQGFYIELNDMHGKPKSIKSFNKGGLEISSEEYVYQAKPYNGGFRLDNKVDVIALPNMAVIEKKIASETEFYADAREFESANRGISVQFGLDRIFAFPVPHFPDFGNVEYKLYRSISTSKIVQNYGILEKIIKRQSGSSITTTNVAYDDLTGNVLVTKTQNEFEKDIYQVTIPAYWAYEGMGGAYQNEGISFKNFIVEPFGKIATYASLLKEGDELLEYGVSPKMYWVTKTKDGIGKQLIDKDGTVQINKSFANLKLVRSGFRNLLNLTTTTYSCLENPIQIDPIDYELKLILLKSDLLTTNKILDAQTVLYDENWSGIPEGYIPEKIERISPEFKFCYGYATDLSFNSLGAKLFNPSTNQYDIFLGESYSLGGNNINCNSTLVSENKNDDWIISAIKSNNLSKASSWCETRPINTYSNGIANKKCWPFYRSGIALFDGVNDGNVNKFYGYEDRVKFDESRIYYFGYLADNQIQIFIDGEKVIDFRDDQQDAKYWHIKGINISAGYHLIRMHYKNFGNNTNNINQNPVNAAFEIYHNLSLQANMNLDILYSSAYARDHKVQSFRETGVNTNQFIYHWILPDGTKYDVMHPQLSRLNPYRAGFLGNFRVKQTLMYQSNRVYTNLFNSNNEFGLSLEKTGYLDQFYSYWKTSTKFLEPNSNYNQKWKPTKSVTLYGLTGEEIENISLSKQYSAAIFDLEGELPSAVANNSRNREMYFNSFEDYQIYNPQNLTKITTNNEPVNNTDSYAHAGLKAINIPSEGLQIKTIVHQNASPYPNGFTEFNANSEYAPKVGDGIYPNGFEPLPNVSYRIGLWIKDIDPTSKLTNYVNINTSNETLELKVKAIVEGWKYVEGKFTPNTTYSSANPFTINISSFNQAVYIDDLRIFRDDANMASYVYHNETLKLMATIDENGFSTFYEYDQEGKLARVKKETEKGIVTLKESRSSNIKK